MRILLVEDDKLLGDGVQAGLAQAGFNVDWVRDGIAAELALQTGEYAGVVLDLGLPRLSGLDLLARLRRGGNKVPVLILTARDRVEDRIKGLDAGADDYLVKPFALAEVAMRIDALRRRSRGEVVENVLRAGALTLDRRTREASIDGRPLHLMPRSQRILEILLHDPGRVVPRAELEAALWPNDPPESDALRSQIHLLRRALSRAGFDDLETVHGIGYRIRCDSPS